MSDSHIVTAHDLMARGAKPDITWAKKHGVRNLEAPYEKQTPLLRMASYEELKRNEEKYGFRISDEEAEKVERSIQAAVVAGTDLYERYEKLQKIGHDLGLANTSRLDELIDRFPEDIQHETRLRAAAALKLSTRFSIPFQAAFANIDLIQSSLYPELKNIEMFDQTISRYMKLADLMRERASTTKAYRAVKMDEASYAAKLTALQQNMAGLQDAIPANAIAQAIGETVQSLSFIREGMIASTGAGLGLQVLLSLAGTAVNPLIGTLILGAGSSFTSYVFNRQVYDDTAYADLYDAGIKDREILEANAGAIGNAQALTESFIGMLPFDTGLSHVAASALVKNTAGRVTAKLFGTGVAGAVKGRLAERAILGILTKAIEIGGEGIEETLQSVEFNAGIQKAAKEYDNLIRSEIRKEVDRLKGKPELRHFDWSKVYLALEDYNESFRAGVSMALVMSAFGVPVNAIKAKITLKEAKERTIAAEAGIRGANTEEEARAAAEAALGGALDSEAVKEFARKGFEANAGAREARERERRFQDTEAVKGAEFVEEGKYGALGYVELAFPNREAGYEGVFGGNKEVSFRETELEDGGSVIELNDDTAGVALTPELAQKIADVLGDRRSGDVVVKWNGGEFTPGGDPYAATDTETTAPAAELYTPETETEVALDAEMTAPKQELLATETDGQTDEDEQKKANIINNLNILSVPMDEREFTKTEYDKLFPNGVIKTPIGEVKIGKNQYEKLRDKDNGGRQNLIGAMHQTLSDPIVIIKEVGKKINDIFIKSFKNETKQDIDTVMSVTFDEDNKKIVISTYKRKTREVINKIKKAGGIVYEKTLLPSQSDHAETAHQLSLSSESAEESSAEMTEETRQLAEIQRVVDELFPAEDRKKIAFDPTMTKRGKYNFAQKLATVKTAADVDAVIHEITHDFAMRLSPDEISAWKELGNTILEDNPNGIAHNFDLTTVQGQEQFADRFLQYLKESAETPSKDAKRPPGKVQALIQRFKEWLLKLWDTLSRIGKNNKEINDYFESLLGKDERRPYNTELIKALIDNVKAQAKQDVTNTQAWQAIHTIKENAVMPRDAKSLSEAEKIAKDNFVKKPLNNPLFNITAIVSGRSLSEMTNAKQVIKAVSPRLQAKAVANADILFERAFIHKTHPDTHNRQEVEKVHRFGAMMQDGTEYVPVKLTVVEYKEASTGNRFYAIEAVDIKRLKSPGLVDAPSGNPKTDIPIEDFNKNIIELSEFVNSDFELYSDDAAAAPEGTAFESGMARGRAQSGVDGPLLMELYAPAGNDVKQTFDTFFAENPDLADFWIAELNGDFNEAVWEHVGAGIRRGDGFETVLDDFYSNNFLNENKKIHDFARYVYDNYDALFAARNNTEIIKDHPGTADTRWKEEIETGKVFETLRETYKTIRDTPQEYDNPEAHETKKLLDMFIGNHVGFEELIKGDKKFDGQDPWFKGLMTRLIGGSSANPKLRQSFQTLYARMTGKDEFKPDGVDEKIFDELIEKGAARNATELGRILRAMDTQLAQDVLKEGEAMPSFEQIQSLVSQAQEELDGIKAELRKIGLAEKLKDFEEFFERHRGKLEEYALAARNAGSFGGAGKTLLDKYRQEVESQAETLKEYKGFIERISKGKQELDKERLLDLVTGYEWYIAQREALKDVQRLVSGAVKRMTKKTPAD